MKEKVVIISACYNCPYLKYRRYDETSYCSKTQKDVKVLIEIPEDCPLEDKE